MAPSAKLRILRKRSQFLKAARGTRAGRPSFALQLVPAADALAGIGFTVSKKVGNSPERNRVKRRLRAAVTACADDFRPAHDYVLVGRREALAQPFVDLVADLGRSIRRVHAPATERPNPQGRAAPRNQA